MEKDKLIYDTSAAEIAAKLEREKQAMQAAIEQDRIREEMKKQGMLKKEKPKQIYNEYIVDEDKNINKMVYKGRDGFDYYDKETLEAANKEYMERMYPTIENKPSENRGPRR